MPSSYPHTLQELLSRLPQIEQAIGYGFHDKKLGLQAFIHKSYLNEQKRDQEGAQSNERLEFLGDAILAALVNRFLYDRFPHLSEGELSSLRSQIVDADACMRYILLLKLENFLLMGKGQRSSCDHRSLYADLFEALLGAIYLDGGWPAAERYFWGHFTESIVAICENPQRNWKADLQDFTQKKFHITPSYCLIDEQGPDHTKAFEVGVMLGEQLLAKGLGQSKKSAQQDAARQALEQLEKKALSAEGESSNGL